MDTMQNGIAVVEVNGDNSKAVFIDEETLFFAKMKALISKKQNKEKHEQRKENIRITKENKVAEYNRRKEEISKYKWYRYTIKTFCKLFIYAVLIYGLFTTWFNGLVAPVIAIPSVSIVIAITGAKFGVWFNRATIRWNRKVK